MFIMLGESNAEDEGPEVPESPKIPSVKEIESPAPQEAKVEEKDNNDTEPAISRKSSEEPT